ncbi:MAG: hypothetical protein HOO93_16855 [Methyloglobulus sp.]|nr:hypothetical protein [Methyloglobulus sp.]
MLIRKSLIALAVAASAFASGNAMAHANMAAKDWYITKDGRSYIEGSSAKLSLNVSHSCPVPSGVTPAPLGWGTVITAVLFPNGENSEVYDLDLDSKTLAVLTKNASALPLTDVLYTTDGKGGNFAGNALMGTKPERDNDWLEIIPKKGTVPTYYNYGPNSQDVRAIHWHGGKVPNELFEDLQFRTSFPKFKPESCVTKIRVFLPAVQYCSDNLNFTAMPDVKIVNEDAWLWAPIPGVFDKVAAPGYAPYIDIDRDVRANPLPKSCRHDQKHKRYAKLRVTDKVIGIYPSQDDIEHFLMHMGNHGGSGTCSTPNPVPNNGTCPPNTHSMGADSDCQGYQLCMANP